METYILKQDYQAINPQGPGPALKTFKKGTKIKGKRVEAYNNIGASFEAVQTKKEGYLYNIPLNFVKKVTNKQDNNTNNTGKYIQILPFVIGAIILYFVFK